ncbi:MAG: FKBP-type peptidyl-prolyl cis-trans isomerase [Anaerolineae bacterium]|nr:FKBP-type peptidyl-prolyl cis-trans isomerase [Anaerolineae bacterium]
MEDVQTTSSGLQYVILEEGTGKSPGEGSLVEVHYTGTLEDGTVFDSSHDRGRPIEFPLGKGQVIPGWDEGIALMKEGSKARLIIPPDLAYGEQGAGGVIPPNATLIFDVELVSVAPAPPPPPEAPMEVPEADYTTTDSGLKYYVIEEGTGASPESGQMAVVHYTGWLEDGTMFDSSLSRGRTFSFPVGVGQVIPGWDEGVASMKVGGKRQLVIPADLGYGENGAGDAIPPNSTLIFEVELIDIQ